MAKLFVIGIVIVVVVWCVVVEVVESKATLNIIWLNGTNDDKLAVCNDGTPSAYYLQHTTDPIQANTWLFYLQAGGQCYSQQSCAVRSTTMMSSKYYTRTMQQEGIFDDNSASPLRGVNKVFVPYCTSDGWIGDVGASNLTWGYHFRGQRVVRSALNSLIVSGFITNQSKILFAGGSAGARGMMNNVDTLKTLLPSGATVLGAFLDSPYYIDIAPFSKNFAGLQYETQQIYQLYNVSAIIPNDCALAYPNEEGWKCLYGQYRIPFVATPFILVASQYDAYQLSLNVGKEPNGNTYGSKDADDYAATWSAMTKSLLTELSSSPSNIGWIHSWACYNHAVSLTSSYYELSSVGISQNDAVKLWLDNVSKFGHGRNILQEHMATRIRRSTETWIEYCSGLFCGSNCGV